MKVGDRIKYVALTDYMKEDDGMIGEIIEILNGGHLRIRWLCGKYGICVESPKNYRLIDNQMYLQFSAEHI
jgi:hypothetical protein